MALMALAFEKTTEKWVHQDGFTRLSSKKENTRERENWGVSSVFGCLFCEITRRWLRDGAIVERSRQRVSVYVGRIR